MMNRALLLLPAFALLVPALSAEAQCPDGAAFCAEIEVEGHVQIGGAPPPPPPAHVEIQVEAPRPRGRVVVVRPAPPPPPPQVVVEPPPPRQTVIVVQRRQQQRLQLRRAQRWNRKFALTGRFGAMFNQHVQMGGAQIGARLRPSRIFGVEFGVGTYVGNDYYDRARREHPVTFDFLFFLPKASRVQAYALIGGGFSFATVDGDYDGFIDDYDYYDDLHYAYIGGQLGFGIELRISPVFALSADIRGFLRTRIDTGLDEPEFVSASGQTTNTSAGALGTLGMHFYF